ncbi:hypothetical protein NX722_03180 [Endozoicomonas gorgoniicola]|uniref:Uncharacterized protein n=1 Tax=Endozoicomonas gorgoniicola TaxID=1234144 RepID=A0ABT3MQK6_9GAMM|nr:hypothetical protein [Endozoicomonas gorgoniicola]MCW7551663.1 hypothetical protein [Endozoicomonas gorgoniicola]
MGKKTSENWRTTICEVHLDIMEAEKLFESFRFVEKVESFKNYCKMVELCNELIVANGIQGKDVSNLLKIFYGDNLKIDGCYQPNLEKVYQKNFDGLLSACPKTLKPLKNTA